MQEINTQMRHKRRRGKRLWRKCVSAMACIVVFCVTYALILPAITLEKDTFCGMTAHVHEDACYAGNVTVCDPAADTGLPILHTHDTFCYDGEQLICQLAELSGHVHTEACYETVIIEAHTHEESCNGLVRGRLKCELSEEAGHAHTDACLVPGDTLVCTEAEREGHSHADTCYQVESRLTCTTQEGEDHAHGDGCYTETKTLICQIPEDPGHTHTDACYEQVLGCGLEEKEGHTHEDACFEMVSVLTCGKEEIPETVTQYNLICGKSQIAPHTHDGSCTDENGNLVCTIRDAAVHQHTEECIRPGRTEEHLVCGQQVHEHTLICYSDPTADLETAEDWEKTFAELQLSGDWRRDVIALAKTQLGYAESTKNYIVVEDDTKGYTRYGDWYGIPYGDWCAMFVSFCLDYTGVEDYPLDASCSSWISKLTEIELYHNEEDYVPVSGDLIFFDWNGNDSPDHVGLVAEYIPATEEAPATVRTIEGNSGNCVKYNEYDLDNTTIMGYGALPFQLTEEEQAQVDAVIAMIDAMPSADEIEAKVEEFAASGDEDGEITWLEEVYRQVLATYDAYNELSEDQKTRVTNADKLLELEYIWSAATLEASDVEEQAEPVYYCDKIAHEHDDVCGGKDNGCKKYVHVHTEACTVKPEEYINVEHGAVGTYYHVKSAPYYQVSSIMVHNGQKYVVAFTFALVPDSVASGPTDSSWTAESAQPVPWSAKTNANYLVAYCAEPYTDYSATGASYGSYVLDESRFTSDTQRRAMAGVLAHAYPFVSYKEMQAELRAAYEAGELTHNVADCEYCTEHEYMAAVQAALWSLVDSSASYSSFSTIDTDGAATSSLYIHPFQAGYLGHRLSDTSNRTKHCNEIKNWLLKQTAAEQLAVSSYDYEITAGEYGTYNLTVTAQLNRPVIAGEHVALQLLAGAYSSEETVLNAGESTFSAGVENITEEELLASRMALTVSGKNLQAYFFDSATSQDFVSGLWEEYEDDLSFQVGVESTAVAVSKVWTDGEPENVSSVEVQLYANGKEHGEPVQLTAENDWSYEWKELMKKDLLGNEISYTIQEAPIDGYFATIEKVDGTGSTVTKQAWVQTDSFTEDGQYLLVSSDGALGMQLYNKLPSFTWEAVDLNDVAGTENMLIWEASGVNAEGGAIMTNLAYPNNPMGITATGNYIYPEGTLKYDGNTTYTSARTELYMDGEGHLYMYNSSGAKRYIMAMYVDGEFRTTDKTASADQFNIYELQTIEIPASEINYVLTNTKIQSETVDVSVTKSWTGRPDEIYPASAVVNLLQNGRAYGTYVTLNEENQWTMVWKDLPLADNDGNEFVYSVREIGLDDYTAEVTRTRDESGNYLIALENTWTPEYVPVELRKVDSFTQKAISGAVFDVYLVTNNVGDLVPGTIDVYGIHRDTVTVDASGKVLKDFAVGESYYLVETVAPAGYNLLEEPIGFTVTKRGTKVTLEMLNSNIMAEATAGETAVLTVKNKVGYILPETGGTGTYMYTMAGLLLMLTSTAYLLYRYRKRRREVY